MATLNYIQEHKQSPSAMRGVMEYCQQKKKPSIPKADGSSSAASTAAGELPLTSSC